MAEQVVVRKGQGDVKLSREEFEARLRERFCDPEFERVSDAIAQVVDVAWKAYDEYHKSPRTRKAGPGFFDPDYELPVEWLAARERVLEAGRAYQDPAGKSRVLLVAGAARHDQTCPGEMSKTFRLVQFAREEIERQRHGVRSARSEPPDRAVRPSDPALQGLRVYGHAVVPLALLLLSQLRHGSGQ